MTSVKSRDGSPLPGDDEIKLDEFDHSDHAEEGERSGVRGGDIENKQPPAPAPAGPPMMNVPDGGLTAWLQVVGAWSLFFNTWGNLNTFGIFQTYYSSGALFTESTSDIAWIGAIQAFLLLSIGLFSGPIYDRGYLKTLVICGSFMTVLGYMMLSLCNTFWQVILAQGFCVGIGGGLLFVPSVSVLPTYFRKRLGLAIGLAASGSSMGGVIFPIVFYRLVYNIGFPWTVRVIGFIALATLLVPIAVMKQAVVPKKPRTMIDYDAFTDTPYVTFVLGCFLGFTGLYVVLFYLSYFAGASGITDDKLAFYIVPILNAASVLGRTLPNAISDKVGTFNIITPFAFFCGILTLCLIAVHSVGGIITIAVLYGFTSGVFIALPPVCLSILTKDKSKIGTRIGMAFAFLALATLVGGPATGAIIGENEADLHFDHAWIYGGVVTIAAGCIFVYLRMQRAGWGVMVKV